MIKLAPSTPELRERQSESLCMCEGRLGLGTERGGFIWGSSEFYDTAWS